MEKAPISTLITDNGEYLTTIIVSGQDIHVVNTAKTEIHSPINAPILEDDPPAIPLFDQYETVRGPRNKGFVTDNGAYTTLVSFDSKKSSISVRNIPNPKDERIAYVPLLGYQHTRLLYLEIQGATKDEIGDELSLTPKQVINERIKLNKKLGVHTRSGVILSAVKHGFLTKDRASTYCDITEEDFMSNVKRVSPAQRLVLDTLLTSTSGTFTEVSEILNHNINTVKTRGGQLLYLFGVLSTADLILMAVGAGYKQ